MSHDENLEPLDPELARLFAQERSVDAMPHDAPARLFGNVAKALALPLSLPPSGGGSPPPPSAAAPPAGASLATSVAKAKATHLLALVIGAAAGVAGYGGYDRLAGSGARSTGPAITVTPPLSSSPAPDMPTSTTPIAPTPSLARAPAPLPPAARSSEAPPTHDGDLAAERAELEIARTALGRGEAARALGLLLLSGQHFPHGRLREERDSLRIQALVASGRRGEADQSANVFRKNYPQSLFQPAIDAALEDSTTDP